VPLGRYIADFVAPAERLVVEVDGGYHVRRAGADARRDRKLARMGYEVLRRDAELVEQQLAEAVARGGGASSAKAVRIRTRFRAREPLPRARTGQHAACGTPSLIRNAPALAAGWWLLAASCTVMEGALS
jgi:hypothetical protein